MSVSGYSLSKINALLRARDREMQLQRMKSQQQAQQAAGMAELVGSVPGAAYDLYSGVGKAMDEEAKRKIRDAMLMAESGEQMRELSPEEQVDAEYARVMADTAEYGGGKQAATDSGVDSDGMTDAQRYDAYKQQQLASLDKGIARDKAKEYGEGAAEGLPDYIAGLNALTAQSSAMPDREARDLGAGAPVSPDIRFPSVQSGGEVNVMPQYNLNALTAPSYAAPDNNARAMGPTGSPLGIAMPQTGGGTADVSGLGLAPPEEDVPEDLKNSPQYQFLKKKVGSADENIPVTSGPPAYPAGSVPTGMHFNLPVPLPQATPSGDEDILFEKPTTASEETNEEPSLAQAQKEYEPPKPQDDPGYMAQKSYLDKIQSYKPPKYAKNEKEIARNVVRQVFEQQPAGNPLLNILTLGQYQNNMDTAKKVAEKMVIKEIRKEREAIQEKHFNDFENQAKLEAQALRLQQTAIDQKRRADIQQQKLGIRIQKPDDAVAKLNDYVETDNYLGDVVNSIYTLDRANNGKGQPLPYGAAYTLKLAAAFAKAATPQQARAIGGQLNAALAGIGAGGGLNISVSGKIVKEKVLQDAAEMIMKANMTPEQRALSSRLLQAIQVVGKAKEGGRMTDADLRFYLDNLVAMDNSPRAMLESINYLRKINARSHNLWLNTFNNIYGPSFLGGRSDMIPDFVDESTISRFDQRKWSIPPELQKMLSLNEMGLADVATEGKAAAAALPGGGGGLPPDYNP